ncbi:MAG: GumC family protein [Bacteroidia bacterium]
MKDTSRQNSSFSVNDLQKFLPLVRKNWWIVALFTLVSFGLGWFYVFKLDKIYAASTQLLLKSNDQYNNQSLITENSGGFYGASYKTYIDNSNETRVIRSQDLIEKALRRLDFDVSYFLVGRIRTTEVYEGVPFSVEILAMDDQLYEQRMKVRFINNSQFEITYTLEDKPVVIKGKFNEPCGDTHASLIVHQKKAFMQGKQNGQEFGSYLVQPHRMQDLTKNFLSRLKVENPEYTNVLKMTIEDVIPRRAVRFLDTLSQVYIDNSLKSRLEVNKNTLFYIDRQMEEVANFLDNIEDTLQRYREINSVIDLEKQGSEYFNQLSQFETYKRNLLLQLLSLDDLEKYVIEDRDPAFLPPSAYQLEDDQFQIKTLSDLYNKQLQLNELLTKATPDNFAVKDLKNQIESTKRDILVYIKNSRVAIREKIKGVDEQIGYYDNQLHFLPVKQRGLLNIMRKQKVNEDMYLFLLQKRANTIIARATIVPETKIIEKSRPIGIVSPNESKLIWTFLGVGIILSLFIVLIRIFFYNRLETYEELKSATSLPILGDVVFNKDLKELTIAVEHDPKSPLAESFRTIRTNLQYMAPGEGTQTIVVTSNNPGEGKTFCSLNLATAIANAGRKVVLLELDLHKPRVHKGLNQESDKGISTYIIGKHTATEIIIPSAIENLDVILAGPIPPNPSELIMTKPMAELIEHCKKHYEYVIIDTPPVGLISDALVLMKMASILLFVLNTRYAYRSALDNAHDIVAMNPSLHFGFILNGVKRKKSKYYYNRYGYGYGSYGGSYGSYGGYGGYGNYGYGSGPAKRIRTVESRKKSDN